MGDLSEQDREALLVAMRSVLGNYDPATGPLFAVVARIRDEAVAPVAQEALDWQGIAYEKDQRIMAAEAAQRDLVKRIEALADEWEACAAVLESARPGTWDAGLRVTWKSSARELRAALAVLAADPSPSGDAEGLAVSQPWVCSICEWCHVDHEGDRLLIEWQKGEIARLEAEADQMRDALSPTPHDGTEGGVE